MSIYKHTYSQIICNIVNILSNESDTKIGFITQNRQQDFVNIFDNVCNVIGKFHFVRVQSPNRVIDIRGNYLLFGNCDSFRGHSFNHMFISNTISLEEKVKYNVLRNFCFKSGNISETYWI